MKKILICFAFLLLGSFAVTSNADAAGTTCTVSLSAPTGHLITYEIRFRIWDNGYSVWYTNWSNWTSLNVGTTYNYPIPFSVEPDCANRWIVFAEVRQLYDGNPTGYLDSETDGPMSSDDYANGNISFSLTIP